MATQEVSGLTLAEFLEDWRPETQGENDFTVNDIMAKYDCTKNQAYYIVRQMEESGEVIKMSGLLRDKTQRNQSGIFYRIVKS